jgi:hypothetical protein
MSKKKKIVAKTEQTTPKIKENAVSTVVINVLSDVLLDKRYNIGEHEISHELRKQIEDKSIVKK